MEFLNFFFRWLTKWLSISILIISVIFIFSYLSLTLYEKWKKTEITVIALECKYKKIDMKPKWYLFKQRRDGSKPMKLYRGAHAFHADKSFIPKEKIIAQSELKDLKGERYYFGMTRSEFNSQVSSNESFVDENKKRGHEFNRKTLAVRYISDTRYMIGSCKEISKKEFYQKIKTARENMPELYKF